MAKEQEYTCNMYHHAHAKGLAGKLFKDVTAKDIKKLESDGWRDSPGKADDAGAALQKEREEE